MNSDVDYRDEDFQDPIVCIECDDGDCMQLDEECTDGHFRCCLCYNNAIADGSIEGVHTEICSDCDYRLNPD